jgi:hypothetical protein
MERKEPWSVAWRKWLSESSDTNPYATADSLRAWDNVIRNAAADALEAAAARWREWAMSAQRALPMPSREHPLPDPEQMAAVRALQRTAAACSDKAAAVRALEMPAHDRVFHRLRNQEPLLEALIAYDAELAACVEALADLAGPGSLAEEPDRRVRLETTLSLLAKTLRARQEALIPRMPL